MESINIDEEIIKKEGHHKYFGIELNRLTWSLLCRTDRTAEENELMLNAAHGSNIHWRQVGTAVHFQRGEWLIARVYSELNIPERALFYAERCRKITEDNREDMKDYDIAYADEAMAWAFACSGKHEDANKYLKSAINNGNNISGKEEKEIFEGDLKSGPWYGLNIL
jgi:hypothetical protein